MNRVLTFCCVTLALGVGACSKPAEPAPTAQEPLARQIETPAPPETPAKPAEPIVKKDLDYTNLLIITVDTLRADHLSCYGNPNPTTPNIDAVAKEGTLFEYTFAPKGSTWPSLATIQTGLYPVTHGVRYNGMTLDSKHETLAETLAPKGYTSAVFIANGGQQKWEGFEMRVILKDEPRDKGVSDAAVDWLDKNGDKKFYLWLHYMAPHGPYEPLKEFNRFTDTNYKGDLDGSYERLTRAFVRREKLSDADIAYVKGLYDGEVAFNDFQIGRVLDKVASLGILDDTLVVISADHGEELGDHHGYWHHQASLYDGTLHVPLIFQLPGKVPAGVRETTPVSLADIAPTVLELLGVERPQAYEGVSLAAAFNEQPIERGAVFGEWGDKMLFVRTKEHKYIYNPSGFEPPVKRERNQAGGEAQRKKGDHTLPIKKFELYDIAKDPRELSDIGAQSADVIGKLDAELKAGYIDKYGWKLENKAEELLQQQLDPEMRKELENLGYVQ
ncbi:MAG: sulfatase [Candidatus Hydrogenedentes bacterium]|nr:sulfatase [Candidatus Hydrogenedentota bacterium]